MASEWIVAPLFVAVHHITVGRLFRLDGPDLFGRARDQLRLFWSGREARSEIIATRRLALRFFTGRYGLRLFVPKKARERCNFPSGVRGCFLASECKLISGYLKIFRKCSFTAQLLKATDHILRYSNIMRLPVPARQQSKTPAKYASSVATIYVNSI